MRRITTVEDFDRWANDPEILAKQGFGAGKTDNSWFFGEEGGLNVALEHDACCMPFECTKAEWKHVPTRLERHFDMHFLFPADRRGARAVAAARKMVMEMFTRYCAARITGTIPRWNLAARMIIRHLGFAPVAETELAGAPAIQYALDKATWLGQQSESAQASSATP